MARWSAQHVLGPYTLAALIWRGRERCTWCGVRVYPGTYAIDHVLSRAAGGSDSTSNLVLACRVCNTARGCSHAAPRRARAERSYQKAWAEVRRQARIRVGRGTVANRAARRLARVWFGAAIDKDLAYARAYKARGGEQASEGEPF